MSGYSSKKAAVDCIKRTIENHGESVKNYNMSAIIRELVYCRGGGYYGWGINPDSDAFFSALKRAKRTSAH